MLKDLKLLYDMIERHPLNLQSSYYEEENGVLLFYNKTGHLVMIMPKQDWLDIVKNDVENK